MANEYCVNCTWASGGGRTLWCNKHKQYVDKYDTCRDFKWHGIALETPETVGLDARMSSPASAACAAAARPRSGDLLNVLRNLAALLRK